MVVESFESEMKREGCGRKQCSQLVVSVVENQPTGARFAQLVASFSIGESLEVVGV